MIHVASECRDLCVLAAYVPASRASRIPGRVSPFLFALLCSVKGLTILHFSEISPDEHDYFHVTSFSGRPEEIGLRVLGVVDNGLRNIVSKVLRKGRGRDLVNKTKS